MQKIKISQAISCLTTLLRAGLVPMLSGSPGMGKSAIVKQLAEQANLKLIDLRLSQCDPTDLLGFPTIKDDRAGYRPMETFPLMGDDLPEGYEGWLLFLDELSAAPPAVQVAAYKILLDRQVGIHDLHSKVLIVGAGNKLDDGAVVENMSTALQSRLVHLELAVDANEWDDWAVSSGVDTRITSFIKFKPDMLYNFRADHTDVTYACPRTWEFTDKILKVSDVNSPDMRVMLSGTLGNGAAAEFLAFCKIKTPNIKDIIKDPMAVEVSDDPSVQYSLAGAIAQRVNDTNIDPLVTYIGRMPAEFQVICLRDIIRRHPTLSSHKAITAWKQKAVAFVR